MDERQIQEVNSIASKAFCTMYIICAVSIMIQLIVTDNGLTNVIGETVTILFGGIVYLVGSIRMGIFSIKGNGLTWMNNLMVSIICSGVFSALFGAVIEERANSQISIGRYVAVFFILITILGFLTLTIMNYHSKKIEQKNEEKYYN